MQGKKIRPSGKSGGLELTKDSSGCVAREGRHEWAEDLDGVLILCTRMSLSHPSPCCSISFFKILVFVLNSTYEAFKKDI